tara:strand:- start:1306 stop:2268 length:963 start_codon:yes stop_codon:yes gene_type:complete
MKKMLLHKLNSKLMLEHLPKPICGDSKILIKVCFTGINFADTLLIQGKYQEKQQLPFSPGMEMSGIIVEIGEKVTGFEINQRVIVFASSGGLSEYISVEPNRVISIPDEMSLKEAACFVIAYATSYLALNYRAKLKKGETLLISGAGGGVGISAVQIGKIMEANVIAVTNGKEKSNLAKKSGADFVIDISIKPFKDFFSNLKRFDVVYDTVGGSFLREAISFVNTEARVLPIGFASGEIPLIPANIFMVKNIDLIGFYWAKYIEYKPEILKKSIFELFYFFKKGLIKPSISKIFELEESNEAINLVKKRKSLGKVLVKIE